MKKSIVILFVLIILLLAVSTSILLHVSRAPAVITPTPTSASREIISPTSAQTFCSPSSLQASLSLEGAAGSIYGTLQIKNTSAVPCQIQSNQFVQALSSARNITIQTQGAAGPEMLTLSPNQTVYSQVRYQNGPQCSSQTIPATISFSYAISPNSSVTFASQRGIQQVIQVCQSATEKTLIQVWSLSPTPISP